MAKMVSSFSRSFYSALALGVAALALPQAGAQSGVGSAATVLTHVTLIDGTGRTPVKDATLVIEGTRIAAIHSGNFAGPPKARVLDMHGDTVMPGIINAHGHLAQFQDGENSTAAYTAEHVLSDLRQYESYGVTTILALGLNKDLLYPIRQQQREGKLDGATVFTADRGIGAPGSVPGPTNPEQNYRPATVEQARAAVDDMAARHADFVKIWVDSAYGTKPKMQPEIYRAVIEEAHKHHLRVAAHVYYLADAKELVKDGVNVLAHSVRDQPVDAELISLLKQRGVWYIPTFTVDESFFVYAEHPAFMQVDFFKAAVPPGTLAMLSGDAYAQKVQHDPATAQHRADFRMDQQNLKALFDAGVHIGFGTDSGAFPVRIPGFAEHRELEDMVHAGLTPMQAIVCATRNNAELLGTAATRGTLQVGKRADLIVLAANPLDDITNTRHIVAIFHDGRQVKPRVPVVMAR
ncbi:MAG TPA: amidohydrolase family protein [Acidobacteriaceae bacterium]|nr:amidohydrolase family protein [Acidobacteriaceae bacterium]